MEREAAGYAREDRKATTFADDTTSGRWSTLLRGPRRVTIVARTNEVENYDWLLRFRREFLPSGVEAKSTNVLPILDLQDQARKLVLHSIEDYAIFIIDFCENRRELLDGIVARLRPVIPPGLDPYDFVLQLPRVGSLARQFLLQAAITRSVVGRIESLLEWLSNPFASELEREGFHGYAGRRPVEIASRTALERMGESELKMFLGRLGVAVGDALSPERQARAIQESVDRSRFFFHGYFACRLLTVDLTVDRVYDTGPLGVHVEVESTHRRVYDFVTREAFARVLSVTKRGLITERASHMDLGLQAADIAAALASREYELTPDDVPAARARAVKRLFAQVCLNGRWI